MRFLLVDTMNMLHRASHVSKGDGWLRSGLSVHILFNSIAAAWNMFDADHVVFALECKSNDNWRRRFDSHYKLNRAENRKNLTQREQEDMEMMFQVFDDFVKFIEERTNATVLKCPHAEADDSIARWIQNHPNDDHILISTDRDFNQLLAPNVIQFDGVGRKIYSTVDRTLFNKLETEFDKDIKVEDIEDTEYLLFKKIIRGDPGDNIFKAYPGVPEKSTKKKTGIIDAYMDSEKQGFSWNNFMMQRWTDHKGNEHLVRDCYYHNKRLIDLREHPEDIQKELDNIINQAVQKDPRGKISIHFMKFCSEYELNRVLDRAQEFANILGSKYQ